jgi:hypothetical protein
VVCDANMGRHRSSKKHLKYVVLNQENKS